MNINNIKKKKYTKHLLLLKKNNKIYIEKYLISLNYSTLLLLLQNRTEFLQKQSFCLILDRKNHLYSELLLLIII